MKTYAAALCLLLAAACGSSSTTSTLSAPNASPSVMSAAPSPASSLSSVAKPKPTPPTQSGPHFATPEAAMDYLAAAWNRNDLTSLKHVTDPNARGELLRMHSEAADLRLNHCTRNKERGDYECFFDHGFPPGYKSKGPVGTAEFTVGPADKPGWYMTVFVDCGG